MVKRMLLAKYVHLVVYPCDMHSVILC
jgi:hypothetical protein